MIHTIRIDEAISVIVVSWPITISTIIAEYCAKPIFTVQFTVSRTLSVDTTEEYELLKLYMTNCINSFINNAKMLIQKQQRKNDKREQIQQKRNT